MYKCSDGYLLIYYTWIIFQVTIHSYRLAVINVIPVEINISLFYSHITQKLLVQICIWI